MSNGYTGRVKILQSPPEGGELITSLSRISVGQTDTDALLRIMDEAGKLGATVVVITSTEPANSFVRVHADLYATRQ